MPQNNNNDFNCDHPDKVNQLLGNLPRSLTVTGIVIIAVIFAVLIAASVLVPYPYGDGESIFTHLLGN